MIFGPSAEIDILLEGKQQRSIAKFNGVQLLVYRVMIMQRDEIISGLVMVRLKPGRKIEHQGIKLELLGVLGKDHIETSTESLNEEFITSRQIIEAAGTLIEDRTVQFRFSGIDKPYETYHGSQWNIKYIIRATITRVLSSDISAEIEICIQNNALEPEINSSMKIEAGFEDAVHIMLEFNKYKFHLREAIIGKLYIHLIRVRLKQILANIVKKEVIQTVEGSYSENHVLGSFEVLDGMITKGDSVPIRVYLKPYELSPTYTNLLSKVSVRYYINVILEDEEGRLFIKQQEIVLWRKEKVDKNIKL